MHLLFHDSNGELKYACRMGEGDAFIGDRVFNDLNGNGLDDGGEPGIANITLKLTGDANYKIRTGSSGNYLFSGLKPGTYKLDVKEQDIDLPPG